MSNNEIMKKLESYQELKRLKEELEAEMKMIQQELINEMETMGTNELRAGQNKATYKEVKSNRFDSRAFKSENPDTYKAYCKESISHRFLVA